jgi:PIN domain nuclease of toxin-antitoxin system
MIKYLLDTHAFVWTASPNPKDLKRLGVKARRIIDNATPDELAISDNTIMEIGCLLHIGKLDYGLRRPTDVLGPAFEKVTRIPMSLTAAINAPSLALPHGDPNDRLIVATALELGVPLITKDANITDSGIVPVVW